LLRIKGMKHTALALCATLWTLPAAGQDFGAALHDYYASSITGWAQDPALIAAIRAQNAVTAGFTADQIAAADRAWQAEIGAASTPTITPVLHNAAADFLRGQVAAAGGRITEVILMDAVGLNVAVSAVTSDYWQGDEAKFSQTYAVGADAIHLGTIELDESTGRYAGQISFTVVDPANGEAVGAMTVGLDAELIQ